MKSRHIILTILAALSVMGCVKVDIDRNSIQDDQVDFSWYARRSSSVTKADDSFVNSGSTNLPIGSSFGVFGYFHPQIDDTHKGGWNDTHPNYPNLLYNEPVTIGGTTSAYTYTYTNSRFWPKNTMDRISFIAYYPYQNQISADGSPNPDAVVEPVLDSSYGHEGMVSFNYQVKSDAADHVDFMVSDMCMDQSKKVWDGDHSKGVTGTEDGKVKFYFHHALALVRVKSVNIAASLAANPDIDFTVSSIKFNGIYVYGNCQPTLGAVDASTGRTTVTESWSNLLTIRPGESNPTGVTAHVSYDSSNNTWDSGKYLLMIPHESFQSYANISVSYSLRRRTDANTGENYEYTNNVLTANLASPVCSSWEAGKIYTYNITLNLREISFTADVIDWLPGGEDVFMEEVATP